MDGDYGDGDGDVDGSGDVVDGVGGGDVDGDDVVDDNGDGGRGDDDVVGGDAGGGDVTIDSNTTADCRHEVRNSGGSLSATSFSVAYFGELENE